MASRLNISQQEYSRLEQKPEIDDDLLEKIASVLDFPVEAIKHIEASTTMQTVYQNNGNTGNGFNVNATDKMEEMYERLLKEKEAYIDNQKEIIRMQKDVIELFKKQQKAS